MASRQFGRNPNRKKNTIQITLLQLNLYAICTLQTLKNNPTKRLGTTIKEFIHNNLYVCTKLANGIQEEKKTNIRL